MGRSLRPERDVRGRRDDDLGQSVVGFGSDIPAFMLVAARPRRRFAEVMAEDTES